MSTRSGRHVIVEGPDGAGKTRLVEYLSQTLDIPRAPKISDSLKGVTGIDLAGYVDRDLSIWANYKSPDPRIGNWSPTKIESKLYDRYPLISEPIYGQHVRHKMADRFLTPWYHEAWERFLALDPLVIFCMPPYNVVCQHVTPERDMPGVWRNLDRLYTAYAIEALKYPGTKAVYDYTTMKPGDLITACSRHLEL
jgi:hypothetical protein